MAPTHDPAPPSRDTANLPIPPPFLYFIPFLIGILLHHLVGGDRIPASALPVARIAGAILAAIGLAINVSAWIAFHRVRTPVMPTRPTTAIATTGPYRFTRNPLYLSLAIIHLGAALLLGYLWPLLFLPLAVALISRLVIAREEAYLEGKFGAEYTRYRDSVRRWL
jgi:protein-S-isoprenylcysteine O-methyltransferase Ste14